jgi:hypothetical protein
MTYLRTLYAMTALGLALWAATITTLAFGADYPLIACESDKIIVVIDQPQCAPYDGPTLGPGEPQLGPGGTCLGPACVPVCDDPLGWVPPGQRITIKLELSAQ